VILGVRGLAPAFVATTRSTTVREGRAALVLNMTGSFLFRVKSACRFPWASGPLVPNKKVFLLVFLRSESQFQHLRTTSVMEWATILRVPPHYGFFVAAHLTSPIEEAV